MNITPIGFAKATPTTPDDSDKIKREEDVHKASQQFESILIRQFLSDSMKSLLENGASGQVYGYMLTSSLADSISKDGGLGLCSVIQSQIGNTQKNAKP